MFDRSVVLAVSSSTQTRSIQRSKMYNSNISSTSVCQFRRVKMHMIEHRHQVGMSREKRERNEINKTATNRNERSNTYRLSSIWTRHLWWRKGTRHNNHRPKVSDLNLLLILLLYRCHYGFSSSSHFLSPESNPLFPPTTVDWEKSNTHSLMWNSPAHIDCGRPGDHQKSMHPAVL